MPIESMFDTLEESSFHLIALKDSKIVAAGRVHLNSPSQAQVRFMCVEQEYRRIGLGLKILHGLENYASKKIALRLF